MRRIVIDVDDNYGDIISCTLAGVNREEQALLHVTAFVGDIDEANYYHLEKGKIVEKDLRDYISIMEDDGR